MGESNIIYHRNIEFSAQVLADFCDRHRIMRLSLFGSALRDDFHDESDVDFLVEFGPEATPTYFRLMEMEEELSSLIGRCVDLRTPMELSKYIRERVTAEAETQYVRG